MLLLAANTYIEWCAGWGFRLFFNLNTVLFKTFNRKIGQRAKVLLPYEEVGSQLRSHPFQLLILLEDPVNEFEAKMTTVLCILQRSLGMAPCNLLL